MVHLDLQPESILINGSEQRFMLGNFGKSRILANKVETVHGDIGRSKYQTPELKEDGTIGFFTDIYCLGCILDDFCNNNSYYSKDL